GLVTVWEFDGFSYVEHFAVQPGLRGAGVGSWVLSQLREPVILEVEPAGSTPEAERRIRFYERNGFRVLDVQYVQPPYSPELPELELKLMLRGDIEDIDAVIKTIHKNVYNKV
ncbi:MAG: GNAT family N-acetyltransferase, partial [Muribaculaceae bacterium]